jgi:hypothetical protein
VFINRNYAVAGLDYIAIEAATGFIASAAHLVIIVIN